MKSNYNKLIFEISSEGKKGYSLPPLDVPQAFPGKEVPEHLLRKDSPSLPEVSEPEIIRHFINLSRKNYSVDTGFYPLGSCTMKYNPRINEKLASLEGFKSLHPFALEENGKGALEIMYGFSQMLSKISGMDAITL